MWTDLYSSSNVDIDRSSLLAFNISPSIKYSNYRIYVNAAEALTPGISHWQLYSADSVV